MATWKWVLIVAGGFLMGFIVSAEPFSTSMNRALHLGLFVSFPIIACLPDGPKYDSKHRAGKAADANMGA